MTLKQLLTSLRNRLQEPDSAGRYSNTELVDYLNSGSRRVCRDLKPLLKSAPLTVTAGSSMVSLPVDYLAFHSWTGATTPLEGTLVVANQIIFPRVADREYTINLTYYHLPVDLSPSADPTGVISDLPDRLIDGVLIAAYLYALDSDGDGRVPAVTEEYQNWVSRAYLDTSNKHYDNFRIKVAGR